MKVCFKFVVVSLFFLENILGGVNCNAQTFVIPDPNFKSFLQDSFPSVLDVNGDLILSAAASITADFNATNRNISNIDGLQYFTSLRDVYLTNNNLTTLPDITPITNLRDFSVDQNDLTSLPPLSSFSHLRVLKCDDNKLKQIPSLANLTSLYRIFFRHNQITDFPDVTGCTSLYHVLCSYNKMDSLPDFATNTALGVLSCEYNNLGHVHDYSFLSPSFILRCRLNQLTFEDLWLLAKHPGFDPNFVYQPQDSIDVPNYLFFKERDTIEIDFNFDDTVTANNYQWYKDGNLIASTFTNHLKFHPAAFFDAGKYYCKIKNTGNPSWSGFELITEAITVDVGPCMNEDSLTYSTIEDDCIKGTSIVLDETKLDVGPLPSVYSYKLFNEVSGDTSYYNTKLLNNIQPGFYDLIITNESYCSKTIKNFIRLDEQAKCDVVITPDGDNKNDQYFIEESGSVKIYDVNGVLVKSLNAPAYWNGRNEKGELVTMGVYAIIVDEKDITNITVIY